MRGKILHTKSDELYFVKRTIQESQLKNPDMKILKIHFNCDTILKNEGLLYFCNHIKSIEHEEA